MAALCWSSREEIPHAQGKRNPSKTVGVARGYQRANTLKCTHMKCVSNSHGNSKHNNSKRYMDFPGISASKESACTAGDLGLIPGLGKSPGESNSYPLQYSCLENSMDRGAWEATVLRVSKSWT